MIRNKLIAVVLLGALALAAVFGVSAYQSARAAEPGQTETPPADSAPADTRPFGFGKGGRDGGIRGGYTDEDLAAALGISVDDLTAARTAANQAALDQAVAAGLITQAQADQLQENGAAFPFGGRWSGWLSQNGIDYQALLADALGISTDELQAAYAQAFNTRIDQAVTDGALTQEQADLMKGEYALGNSQGFQSAMQSAFEAAVQQAVADGVITQAQADLILANRSARGFDSFGGFHGPRGGGRHGGGWGGLAPAAPQTQEVTPSADI